MRERIFSLTLVARQSPNAGRLALGSLLRRNKSKKLGNTIRCR